MLRQLLLGDADKNNRPLLSRAREDPFRVVVIGLCLINITLALVNAGIFIIAAIQKLFVAADFTSMYAAYHIVKVGAGSGLYNPSMQSKFQSILMDGIIFEDGVLLFVNPPFVAITFMPLSLFPLNTSFYVWSVIQLVLLFWVLSGLLRTFAHWSNIERSVLILSIISFWPLTYNFMLGQFSLFLFAGLLQLYVSMRDFKLTQAGIWMSLLLIKPQLLLVPAMFTLNRRYWRIAFISVMIGLGLSGVSTFLFGLQIWEKYFKLVIQFGSYFGKYGVDPNTHYSFRGLLTNVFGNDNGYIINLISMIFLILTMGCIWLLWRVNAQVNTTPKNNSHISLKFSITVALTVCMNLHLNAYDSLLLIIPGVLFYDYLKQRDLPKKAYSIFVLLWPLVFLVSAFYRLDLFGVVRLPILLILMLLVWMGYYLVRELRADRQAKLSISA